VFADTATTTLSALAPLTLVLAETAAATVFTLTPVPLVLTDATTAAFFTLAPLPLVLADAAATAVFTLTPVPPVLTDATTAAVFAHVLDATVLALMRRSPATAQLPLQRLQHRQPCMQVADGCRFTARESRENHGQNNGPCRPHSRVRPLYFRCDFARRSSTSCRLYPCLVPDDRTCQSIHTTEATARTNTNSLSAPWRLQSCNSFEAAKPHGLLGCEPAQPPGCEVAVFDSVQMPNLDRLADRGTATTTTRQQVFTTGSRDDTRTNSDTLFGRL